MHHLHFCTFTSDYETVLIIANTEFFLLYTIMQILRYDQIVIVTQFIWHF